MARYKGTIAVAIYSVGATLNSYYTLISSSTSGLFTPLVHRVINMTKENLTQQRVELTNIFIRVGRIQFLILSLVCTGLILFGKRFILYWAGPGYEDSYIVLLLLAIPGTIPLIQSIGIEIQRAENKHQFRSLIYLIMAIINVVLSIYLCQFLGVIGAAIGTSISLLVANGLIMNVYYHKECNIDIVSFWKSILSMMPGIILATIIGFTMLHYVDIASLFSLFLWIVVYSIIYCLCLWLLSMNDYEKGLLLFWRKKKERI